MIDNDSHDRVGSWVFCLVIFLKEKEKNLLDFFLHGMDTEEGLESSFQSTKERKKVDKEWSKNN